MLLDLNLQFFNDDYDEGYIDLNVYKNQRQYNKAKRTHLQEEERIWISWKK